MEETKAVAEGADYSVGNGLAESAARDDRIANVVVVVVVVAVVVTARCGGVTRIGFVH